MGKDKVSTASIIISIIVVFAGILTGWYYYSRKYKFIEPAYNPSASQVFSSELTQKQIDDLIKSMSAGPTATPTLSKNQLEKLSKSMSAPKTAKPALNSDEQKKLIEAMSAK